MWSTCSNTELLQCPRFRLRLDSDFAASYHCIASCCRPLVQVIGDVDIFLFRGANSLSKWGRKRKLESRGRTDIIILPKKQVCQSNESIITHFWVHVVCYCDFVNCEVVNVIVNISQSQCYFFFIWMMDMVKWVVKEYLVVVQIICWLIKCNKIML